MCGTKNPTSFCFKSLRHQNNYDRKFFLKICLQNLKKLFDL